MSHASLQGGFKTTMTMTTIKKNNSHTALSADTAKPIFRYATLLRSRYSALCVRFLLCAVMLISLTACSDQNDKDDPDNPGFEEGIPTEVRITLSSRSGNGTRADGDGDPKDPTSSVELMHDDWWIVFVNKDGGVKMIKQADIPLADRIKSRPSTVPTPDDAVTDGGFEAETFKTILPSGTYRIYAFANIPSMSEEDFQNFLKKDKETGEWKHGTVYLNKLIGDGKFKDPSNPQNDGMQWPATENIPMSGVMTNKIVKNTVEEAFNVEVVRAVAKVEFAFSNPSTDEISLETLKFGPITKDENISFVPNYNAIGKCANDKVFEDVKETGVMTFSNFTLTDKSDKYDMGKFGFYCKESTPASKKGGPFDVELKVKRNNEEKTYTYQTKTITYINRNDWIHIPIKFNDWIIYWKLHYYPPIGGYPPVFKQNADGSSMSATLTTGGEFELYPFKIERNSEAVDYKNDVDWDKVELSQLTDAEKSLFVTDKLPTVMANPNYNVSGHPLKDLPKIIAGEFKPNAEGKVELKFIFYLKNKDINNKDIPYADTKFECTFTVTRQNGNP